MARPRNDPQDSFRLAELAAAAGLAERNVKLLASEGLVPPGNDIKALKRAAVIGAFCDAGLPLIFAGRVADAVLLAFNQVDGEIPSGLDRGFKPTKQERSALPAERNDYHWHHLRSRRPNYVRGAWKNDVLIEIIDRRYLVWLPKDRALTFVGDYAFDLFGLIEDWQRGAEVRVRDLADLQLDGTPERQAEEKGLYREVQDARDNAVSKITINASLAIRRALDRVAELRAERDRKRGAA